MVASLGSEMVLSSRQGHLILCQHLAVLYKSIVRPKCVQKNGVFNIFLSGCSCRETRAVGNRLPNETKIKLDSTSLNTVIQLLKR